MSGLEQVLWRGEGLLRAPPFGSGLGKGTTKSPGVLPLYAGRRLRPQNESLSVPFLILKRVCNDWGGIYRKEMQRVGKLSQAAADCRAREGNAQKRRAGGGG